MHKVKFHQLYFWNLPSKLIQQHKLTTTQKNKLGSSSQRRLWTLLNTEKNKSDLCSSEPKSVQVNDAIKLKVGQNRENFYKGTKCFSFLEFYVSLKQNKVIKCTVFLTFLCFLPCLHFGWEKHFLERSKYYSLPKFDQFENSVSEIRSSLFDLETLLQQSESEFSQNIANKELVAENTYLKQKVSELEREVSKKNQRIRMLEKLVLETHL